MKSQEKLSKCIKCDSSVAGMLTPDTIQLANVVVKTMTVEDSGLFVQIIDHEALHQALALPESPVPQDGNPTTSLAAFKAWLIHGARNIDGDSQVPINSQFSLAFHQLTPPQGRAMLDEWRDQDWNYHLRINRRGPQAARIGEFVNVFCMDGIGPGRATFTEERHIFA